MIALLFRLASGKQNVGAERSLEMVLFCKPVDGIGALDHLLHLRLFRRTELRGSALSIPCEKRLRTEPDALFCHQLRRLLVHQVSVLNAFHSSGDRTLDGLRRVGMGADIGAPIPS